MVSGDRLIVTLMVTMMAIKDTMMYRDVMIVTVAMLILIELPKLTLIMTKMAFITCTPCSTKR